MDPKQQLDRPSKNDLNLVILDYLINEGYAGAAEKFAEETNIVQEETVDVNVIKERTRIRNAIHSGKMQEAIELVNELDAELLDRDADLHFQLLQLQLIEIIRGVVDKGEANPNVVEFRPALEFATQQLAPHAPQDPKHLAALEKTMGLMIFKPEKMIPEMKELLDPSLREKVAADVNKALLSSEGRAPQARIKDLIRARAWAEVQARETGISLPDKLGIGLDSESSEPMMT